MERTNLVPLDIPQAVADLGMRIGRVTYKEVWTLCPYHERIHGRPDRKIGSFSINLETGANKCFGCGGGGIFADVVEERLNLEHQEALLWIMKRDVRLVTPDDLPRKIEPQIEISEAAMYAFDMPPVEEQEARGITEEACMAYGIRWSTKEHGWVLPIRDPDTNQLLGWQTKTKNSVLNYPTGVAKRNTLFGLDAVTTDDIVLVESPLDAAKIWCAGYDAVASYGAAVSDDQRLLLVRKSNRLVLALDDDEAGRRTTQNLLELLEPRMIVSVFRYPGRQVKDPGDMTYEEIETAIETAIPSFKI